jgi:GDPmannose 4,6-dehydratase
MSSLKVALITGITGQDGSYLTELLLKKKYKVWGLVRRSSNINTSRIDHLYNNEDLTLRYGDLSDTTCLINIISDMVNKYNISNKDRFEIYNLGAMSHVKVSFDIPEYTADIDGLGTMRILNAIKSCGMEKCVRFYQASTSELFGKVVEVPQNENTPFYPRSPYGVAKLYSHWIVKNYRESYNMFACSGILFNHESPRRGPTFVTRKITMALGKMLKGEQKTLTLGNIDAKRDWGHARDYVYGMWLMLQQDKPTDYVLSTNEFHSVREFIEKSFSLKGITIQWKMHESSSVKYNREYPACNEFGINAKTGEEIINISSNYFRPAEVEELLGDSSKARKELNWVSETSFDDLVKEMVEADSL